MKRIVIIPNGVTCTSLHSREEARALLAPRAVGKYWVGMLSELVPVKRVHDAISAFALLAARHPEAILIILGEGPEREMLEQHIRALHMQERIQLLGFRDGASSLLKAFDLFLHTSGSEALAYAILEAGCAGVPVVATRVGGIPEIIPDNDHGLLVPARSPEQISKAIESLMTHPNRAAEMGMRLQARVHQVFSKERMLEKTLELYES